MTTPMGQQPDYKGMFDQACQQIGDAIKTVVDKFNAFVKHVYDNRFFLGPALLVIKGAMEKLREGVDKLVQLVQYLMDHQLPVVSLIVQSFNWVYEVHNPISNLSGQVTDYRSENFEQWTGPTRNSYNRKAAEQKAAIDDYVKKSEFVSSWLFNIVKTNVDYVAGLAGIAAKVAGGMVQVSGETVTVVMIPFAADQLAKLISTLVEEGIKTLVKYAQNFIGAVGNVRDIASQVGDATVFTNGKWPVAVAN
jgi:hypothetical protein